MNRVLVVVDYQNDFVSGALGFPRAAELEQGIAALVEQYMAAGDRVVFTLDTHHEDYLNTREGKNLPVEHCAEGSEGWMLYGSLRSYMNRQNVTLLPKQSFGTADFGNLFSLAPDEITLVGVVTNMCVISNAINLQTCFPNANIIIESNLCASFNEELHQKALDVMVGLQMQVR
ncbi:MAG: isochorismatase family cysteine hydrolase [Angelakisella sp.]